MLSGVRSAISRVLPYTSVSNVVFEATQECNQDCVFCYNVWKCSAYPRGELDTIQTKRLLDHIIGDYRPRVISFSGGEPLIRPDIVELIGHVGRRAVCNVITNGTLTTDSLAGDLVKAGIRIFEFTLLSADRQTHNSLVGRDSFDRLIEGIASVRAAGGSIATTFVAMKRNIGTLAETIELSVALGATSMLFNRFNVGGAGIRQAADLMPSVEELKAALEVADEAARRYGISIACGVPIPPCVLDTTRYKSLHFVDCAIGTRNAYPTVDPLGNVRWCNHSPKVLGNVFDMPITALLRSDEAVSYASTVPGECRDCRHASSCRGGCRAAADVCGNCHAIDPFVILCKEEEECAMCS